MKRVVDYNDESVSSNDTKPNENDNYQDYKNGYGDTKYQKIRGGSRSAMRNGSNNIDKSSDRI